MHDAIQGLINTTKEYAVYYFGPDQPQRMWYVVMAACFLALFPQGTRRFGGVGLIGVIVVFAAWNFLSDTFTQTAPPPPPTKANTYSYRR